jgi:hypothetical protein
VLTLDDSKGEMGPLFDNNRFVIDGPGLDGSRGFEKDGGAGEADWETGNEPELVGGGGGGRIE